VEISFEDRIGGEMHGIIFSELRKYAETKHGKETWNTLLRNTGLANKTFLPVQEYPDAEIVAIVGAASSITGLSVSAVLEDFGEFIAPALIKNVWTPVVGGMEDY
jgi:hypothetical protein